MALDIDKRYDEIYRYCYYRLGNRTTAEDITQEAFLRFFASDVPRNDGEALRYLYTVARNLCIDEYRRAKPVPLDDEPPDPADGTRFEERAEIGVELRRALAALPEEDRTLILLRYVNEVPIGVLCKLNGVSRFALYRRLQRITKQLRELIEE